MALDRDDDWKKTWAAGPSAQTAEIRWRERRPASTLPPPQWARREEPAPPAPAQSRGVLGSLILDGAGIVLAFDRNMERLTGWDAFEVVGQSKDLGVYSPPDEQGVRHYSPRPLFVGQLPATDHSQLVRVRLTRKDGAQLDTEVVITPLGGRGNRVALEIHRVLARFASPVAVSSGAERDPLTRLLNAHAFEGQLAAALDRARPSGRPVSVLLVDVDHLEAINETFGRARGDEVLRHVGGILVASIRHSDVAARLGADDFAVLLAGTGRGDARHVGGRIRSAVEAFDFTLTGDKADLEVTTSIGISTFPADAEPPVELLRRAKDALDEVRRLGRNRVWCYARRPRVQVEVPVYFDGPSSLLIGHSRDLSNSGIYVQALDDLQVGMRLGLCFVLPGSTEAVRVIGRVVRQSEHDPNLPGIGVGIEFERCSNEDRWRLETFLHHHRP